MSEKKFLNQSADLETFDWDSYLDTGNYSAAQRKDLENSYSGTLQTLAENDVTNGTVVSIGEKDVVVSLGYKSEGVVPTQEFKYNPDLKIGDVVEVFVEKRENKFGQISISHKKAQQLKAWDRVNEALATAETVKGFVKCRTKGGLIVEVFGLEAFLPGSQIDVKPIRDYDIYVGKTMDFRVVKINLDFRNVVVSHKALIEQEIEQQKGEIMSRLEKGQVLEGTVKNITSYGVFIDLGGVDGLIHITDLSWGRINHPEEIVKIDEQIQVVILEFDETKKRIALGLKQLTPHPWEKLVTNINNGDKIKGKVVVLADYGAFIEIEPGVEGLIHVSEMSWSQHLRTAQDFLTVGQEVEAVVTSFDKEERKMSLSIKQLTVDPWAEVASKFPVGSKHTSKVRNFTNFGIFVELEEGVDGLVHISDLSYTKKIKHPSEFTKIGSDLEVVVLEIDAENRRLSLGHKQLEENPWDVFESVFTIDSIHPGTVLALAEKGATIGLQYGLEAFVPGKHMVKEDGSTLKVEEKADFRIIEFSKDAKKIVVSHSKIHEDANAKKSTEETESTATNLKKVKDKVEKATLGDLFNAKEDNKQ